MEKVQKVFYNITFCTWRYIENEEISVSENTLCFYVKQPTTILLTPAIWYHFREFTKNVTSPTYAANKSRPWSAGNTSHP